MKVAILESILMPAGHEIEFDRILVDELQASGHEAVFFVPQAFPFKLDYGVPAHELAGGPAISYAGAGPLKKLWLSLHRETRRKKWFDDAFVKACAGLCDAIIIPTATYRYTRALLKSALKNSPVPVILVMHGINPKEKGKFLQALEACKGYENIHFVVLTLRQDLPASEVGNLHLLPPPVYTPRDLPVQPEFTFHQPLRLGFFGQYRKEKNVEFFIEAFAQAEFIAPVELIIQGATAKPSDEQAFLALADNYKSLTNVKFWHENLIGECWQRALLDSDVLLLPYAAERYRYHWSAMLFTAIGYYKPVLQSPEINPEVLAKYDIGEVIDISSIHTFSQQLEQFVNGFADKAGRYKKGLIAANEEFSPQKFVERLLKICEKK